MPLQIILKLINHKMLLAIKILLVQKLIKLKMR